MDFNWIEFTESKWRNLQMDELSVDEAYLQVISHTNSKLWMYELSKSCVECPFSLMRKIDENRHIIKLDVSESLSLKIFDKNQGKYDLGNSSAICSFNPSLGEFGVYNLTIHNNLTCSFDVDKKPVNIYLSLLTVFLILSCLSLVLKGFFIARSKYFCSPSEENEEEVINQSGKKRLKSLDLFRGLVIVLMIFVNSGGGKYSWIEHASWNGLHLADIVFPSFLWIMGVCIPISIIGQLRRSVAKLCIFQNIISRSLKLFFIGVCLNSINGPLLSELRIMGVLQRFGVCYLFCATIHLFCTNHRNTQNILHRTFVDIIILKSELILCLCLIIINLAITLGLKRPGCSRGYLGPGGKQNYPSFVNCTGGIIGYIDEKILGTDHIYKHSTAKYLYGGQDFDPEGVFGCLLSTVQVFLGVQCGVLLTTFSDWKSKTIRLLIWGTSLTIIGLILCSFSIDDGYITINKNLWSLSFVCVTSGISFLLFLFLFLIVDVKMYWSGYPFVECGMNAIVMYVGHSVLHKMLPWHWRIGLMNTHFVLLLESCWNTILWIVIALHLYNKKIFYNL